MEGTQFDFSYAPGVTEEQVLGFEMAGEIWSQHLADNVIGSALPEIVVHESFVNFDEYLSNDATTVDNFQSEANTAQVLFDSYRVGDFDEIDDLSGSRSRNSSGSSGSWEYFYNFDEMYNCNGRSGRRSGSW